MNLNTRWEASFQEELKGALQQKGSEIKINPELKDKVMNRVSQIKFRKQRKPRLLTVILAATLFIMSTGFATQLLADQFYGSFDNLKKHAFAITVEKYLSFNAKLSEAKGELGEKQYQEFTLLLKAVTDAKLNYSDKYGSIDFDQLPPEKVAEIKQAYMAVQPYFDKLNGDKSCNEILTPKEFEEYIEAQMTHEKILAQSGINPSEGPVDIDKVKPELKDEYIKAKNIIGYVYIKQQH